jgi:hypothetical protein
MMYWRVRKYGPQEMLRQYGLHVVLVMSVLFNIFQIATRPNPNKSVGAAAKTDFEQFAKRVTTHILDTSYINYKTATYALVNTDDPDNASAPELAPPVVANMRAKGLLPKSNAELEAGVRTSFDEKRVCAINVQSVRVGDTDAKGLIPIDVTGVMAVRSAEDSTPGGPVKFHFQYRVGYWKGKADHPVVSDFADLSG